MYFSMNFRSSFKFVRQVEWPGLRKKRVCRIKKIRTEREKIICTVIRSLGFQSIKEDAHTPRRAYRGKKQMNKFAFQNNPIPSTSVHHPLFPIPPHPRPLPPPSLPPSPPPSLFSHTNNLYTYMYTRAFFRTPTPVLWLSVVPHPRIAHPPVGNPYFFSFRPIN